MVATLNRVVLPAPFGPIKAQRLPLGTVKVTSSMAGRPPNIFVTARQAMGGGGQRFRSLFAQVRIAALAAAAAGARNTPDNPSGMSKKTATKTAPSTAVSESPANSCTSVGSRVSARDPKKPADQGPFRRRVPALLSFRTTAAPRPSRATENES